MNAPAASAAAKTRVWVSRFNGTIFVMYADEHKPREHPVSEAVECARGLLQLLKQGTHCIDAQSAAVIDDLLLSRVLL